MISNKFSFTKGPWVLLPEESDKDYLRIRGGVWGDRYKIANVHNQTHSAVRDTRVLKRMKKESFANARLIQKAPEMLKLLCELDEFLCHDVDYQDSPFENRISELFDYIKDSEEDNDEIT